MRSATLAVRLLAVLALLSVNARRSGAQGTASGPASLKEDAVCLGFAFGGFTPKLDWAKAGHAPVRAGAGDRAPDGRDWASDATARNDTTLYLFPSWWPVGVLVDLPSRHPALGDTLLGRATALVARGDITPPTARIRAWRIPCARPAASDTLHQRARPN